MGKLKGLLTFAFTSLIVFLIGLAIWNQLQKRLPAIADPVKKVINA